MTNRSHPAGESPRQPAPPVLQTEPPVRRWPGEIPDPVRNDLPVLHYLRCSLSYQNQLLAEIKTLLQVVRQLLEEPEN